MQGDPHAALPYLEQCREITEGMGARDPESVGQVKFMESFVIGGIGDHAAAVEAARVALDSFEESHADERIPFANNRLGIELAAIGQNAESETQFRLALERWRARGSEWGEVTALINLAIAARNRGDYAQAVSDLTLCLEPAHRQGDPWGEAETRLTMAGLAAILGDQAMSIRFQASAERIRQAIGLRLQEYIDPALIESGTIEERMKDPGFAAAWTEGQTAPIGQLVTWATELWKLPNPASGQRRLRMRPSRAHPTGQPVPRLTQHPFPREMEVLRLMAEGLSSREIGERLFISPVPPPPTSPISSPSSMSTAAPPPSPPGSDWG